MDKNRNKMHVYHNDKVNEINLKYYFVAKNIMVQIDEKKYHLRNPVINFV